MYAFCGDFQQKIFLRNFEYLRGVNVGHDELGFVFWITGKTLWTLASKIGFGLKPLKDGSYQLLGFVVIFFVIFVIVFKVV